MLVNTAWRKPLVNDELSGVVYSALLNHRPQLEALGDAVNQPPHKAPPKAPVLELKPRHMLATDGAVLDLPAGVPGLRVTANLGIVLARTACRVPVAQALDFVAGFLVVGEVSLPLESHYRPGARLKARDGFCPLGAAVVPARQVEQPDKLALSVHVDGAEAQRSDTGQRLRGVAQLLADVTDFMTLQAGDVLCLGASHGAPLVQAGRRVRLAIEGVGELHLSVRAVEATA
jgi:5-oxopent-3-ene-1,2,5-tricarboxylate decarboxylase/2-hydroxyhepta-2,4-diene-1,7-dioate isomerase